MTQESAAPPARWQLPFFTIWTGQSLSLFGSRIAMFALIWWLTADHRLGDRPGPGDAVRHAAPGLSGAGGGRP